MSSEYEYDVAFSFHASDEGLASELNDLLSDRFRTFIYSKKQERLAGTDGELTFGKVYGETARCVVVFYRPEWGETPFTRIEQDSIRNRAFEHGYDFTFFIPTGKPPSAPKWLPRTRLWFGLERFGMRGAAGAIEARIQELGGEPRLETAAHVAARAQRAIDLRQAQERFRSSEGGVEAAKATYETFKTRVKSLIEEVSKEHPSFSQISFREKPMFCYVAGAGPWLIVNWWPRFSNSLSEADLKLALFSGVPDGYGFMPASDYGRQISKTTMTYEIVSQDRHGFVPKNDSETLFDGEALADHVMKTYLEAAARHKPGW